MKTKQTVKRRRATRSFVQVACWLTPTQRAGLRAVQRKTRLTQQTLLRDGVDAILAHYQEAPQ
jgi:hypothetical protein